MIKKVDSSYWEKWNDVLSSRGRSSLCNYISLVSEFQCKIERNNLDKYPDKVFDNFFYWLREKKIDRIYCFATEISKTSERNYQIFIDDMNENSFYRFLQMNLPSFVLTDKGCSWSFYLDESDYDTIYLGGPRDMSVLLKGIDSNETELTITTNLDISEQIS